MEAVEGEDGVAWDVVVVGGIGTDYLGRGDDLPTPGRSIQGGELLVAPGGKGLNAAMAAARLGARVALVGCVGSDARGRGLIRTLRDGGVDTARVRREAGAETAATVVQVAGDGRKQTLGIPGANARLSPVDIRSAASVLSRARVVVAQLEPPLETIREAMAIASAAGIPVILDPAPPTDLPDDLLAGVEVLKPNAGEAESLTGIRPDDRRSARRAAERLLARGVRVAAVTADDGVLVRSADEEYWLPDLPVQVVDTTGAGDTFAGALAVALAEGHSLEDAVWFAHAAAALATTRLGACTALPDRAEVLRLLTAARRPSGGSR